MTTQAQAGNSTTHGASTGDLREELDKLKKDQAVMAAEQAGAHATQAATEAGHAATNAATHAGTWSTMLAAAVGFVVGIFLALAFAAVAKD